MIILIPTTINPLLLVVFYYLIFMFYKLRCWNAIPLQFSMICISLYLFTYLFIYCGSNLN